MTRAKALTSTVLGLASLDAVSQPPDLSIPSVSVARWARGLRRRVSSAGATSTAAEPALFNVA